MDDDPISTARSSGEGRIRPGASVHEPVDHCGPIWKSVYRAFSSQHLEVEIGGWEQAVAHVTAWSSDKTFSRLVFFGFLFLRNHGQGSR